MKKVSLKQQKILAYIREYIQIHGYPPSVRDIGAGIGIPSPSTIHSNLKALTEMGYLEKQGHKGRALTLKNTYGGGNISNIPILGRVTAGKPILAFEDIEGYLPVPIDNTTEEHFALHIQGDSMKNAGILDRDMIVVRKQDNAFNGQIVVALLEDEATCKRLKLENGEVWLMPENDAFEPINGENCRILGVVVAVFRQYQVL